MRSSRADHRPAALLALALAAACARAGDAPAPPPAASGALATAVPASAVEDAVTVLRADPDLAGHRKAHTLHWNGDADADPPSHPHWSGLDWLVDFARWLADVSRLLFYGVIAALAITLLVVARRFVRLREFRRRARGPGAVSHVRELDVRPESLPDDVGAAAWALWRAGREREALSLLYRGLLSRLIHRHGVPIEASSTEGECLELARPRLAPGAMRYATQVVRAWEACSYGERALSAELGQSLCTGFATRLDGSPEAAA